MCIRDRSTFLYLHETNLLLQLEEEDWFHEDTEMWIWGPIEIQDENGETVKIVCADKDGNMIDYIDTDE